MEFNKSFTTLIISLIIIATSFSAEAKCVPRNSSINIGYQPVATPQASVIPDAHKTTTKEAATTTSPPASPPSSENSLTTAMQQQFDSTRAKAATIFKDRNDNNSELTRLCGLTDNPKLCEEVAGPLLKGLSDPISVLRAAMQAALDHLHLAIGEAKKFASDAKSSGLVKDCMKTCVENYETALNDFDKSLTAIEQKDIGSLNSNLDSALTMVATCEDTFDENPGVESPMQEIDRKLSMMIDNCLAIRNAIKDIISPPVVV